MLSHQQILEAIKNKEIEILYFFGRDNNSLIQYEIETPISDAHLRKNLYSDRLKLTMGPLVRVLKSNKVKAKYRFKKNNFCFDLRKNNNLYILKPKESIIIITNERIHLNGNYAALIFPRISLSDVGIVVTPAYIDPYYDGLLRLQLTNHSARTFELHTLEAIAQCFFFDLSSCVPLIYQETFSAKSVFFGQNWPALIEEDRDPFPTKKDSAENEDNWQTQLQNIAYQFKEWIKKKGVYVFIIALITGFGIAKNKIERIEKFANSFSPAASEIIVVAGEKAGSKTITGLYDKANIITVLCNNDNISYRIDSGTKAGECSIVFTYELDEITNVDYSIDFLYTVVLESIK